MVKIKKTKEKWVMGKLKKSIAVLLCTLMLGMVISVNVPEDVCSICADIENQDVRIF